MEKRELRKTVEKYGNFLNVSQVAECIGVKRETAKNKYLDGVPYLPNGREKLYFKEDVVNAIYDKLK